MGFMIRWDAEDIKRQLRYCSVEMNSAYNDGFTAWRCKKDLLDLKYFLDEMLDKSPNFSDLESKYLEEREQEKTWKILHEK